MVTKTKKAGDNRVALTKKQEEALRLMHGAENVFLSGEAGTGKSYVLKRFLEETKKNVLVCAPTGIAAINVGGATLHSVFGIPCSPITPAMVSKPRSVKDVLRKADTIVIDEISMCRFDVFEFVANSIRAAGSSHRKQLIVVGDFFQLPPVLPDEDRKVLEQTWGKDNVKDGFAFLAPSWKEFDFRAIVLDEVVRQRGDNDFINKLNSIRRGDKSALDWFNGIEGNVQQNAIYICARNRDADDINCRAAKKLRTECKTYHASQHGDVKDKPTMTTLNLKVDMRVMSIVNGNNYQNGSLGTIKRLNDDSVTVVFDSGEIAEIGMYEWNTYEYCVNKDGELERRITGVFRQLPLKMGYGVSTHRSQGQTYDAVNVVPDCCFAAGQLYVALSRCRSVEKMHLCSKIKSSSLITSEDVLRFYDSVQDVTDTVSKSKKNATRTGAGGSRAGAVRTRKYGGETTTIRVPIEALDRIKAILVEYQR